MSVLREQIDRSFNPQAIGITEFAEEMCAKPLYPRQRVLLKLVFLEEMNGYEEDVLSEWIAGGEVLISPKIRERRSWLRENGYPHFRENILVGGRRSSKGYVTGIAGAKKLYDTQQMGDPGLHYGIDPQKEIYFTCVAASLEQAKQFQFADLAATVGQCKPLAPHLSKLQEEGFSVHTAADERYVAELKSKRIKVNRDFAKLRAKPLAANADTIRGSTSMFICFDEMAFMLPGESRSTAEQCFNAAAPALAQFGRSGLIFCNSSPYTKIGKFYERFELAMSLNDVGAPMHPLMFAFQFPSWELYRDYDKDPERRFKNALMVSPDWPTEPLSLDDQARQMEAKFEEEANPETFKVERRAQWAEVVDAYLRPEMIDRAFDLEPSEGMQVRPTNGGIFQFLYKGHCDPSSTTAGFGFAMAHVEEWNDPNYGGEKVKHVVFDLVKRWNPKDYAGSTIDYISVQEEIADYIQVYRPQEFSFDQFQSQGPIQWLRQEMMRRRVTCMIKEKTATKDVNWKRWETFKTALNLGLVHIPPDCPDAEYASQELKFLQVKNGKVDRQEIGPVTTKDIADCIAECTEWLIGNVIETWKGSLTQGLQLGAQGGFQIGGRDRLGPAAFSDHYGNRHQVGQSPSRGINPMRRGSRS